MRLPWISKRGACDRDGEAPGAGRPPLGRPRRVIVVSWTYSTARVLCMVTAAISAAQLLRLVWLSELTRSQRSVHLLMVTTALSASAFIIIHQYRIWIRPLRQLLELLPLIRQGEAPIEELTGVGGALRPLVAEVQEVLRELRQQKSAVARLELEIQQRVANRTDALQRTIGSLRAQASRDALTGLYNRRMFEQHLPQLVDRTRAEGSYLSLLMIDLDYFKEVNDTLGHAAGDRLLATIGQIIRSGIRDTDLAFRYGGDEFVVVLPETDREHAEGLAQRLNSLVEGYAKTLHLQNLPRLSVGIAFTLDLENPSTENLLHAADQQLYEIKSIRHGGRKRPPHAA
jgi:diguanylate cyclase (GGDEF)-like protein